jgi:hypothetical protein
MKLMFAIPLVFLLIVGLLFLFRTLYVQVKPQQKEFMSGEVPKKMPDGFYNGSVGLSQTAWLGKRFNAEKQAGINKFKNEDGDIVEVFPFVTYIGKGLIDKEKDVIKIDYSKNRSPWWIRFILDEIIEVGPGSYLGKVHINIIPGMPFTVGYFRLTK